MDIFGLLARKVTICVQENRPTILDSGLRAALCVDLTGNYPNELPLGCVLS